VSEPTWKGLFRFTPSSVHCGGESNAQSLLVSCRTERRGTSQSFPPKFRNSSEMFGAETATNSDAVPLLGLRGGRTRHRSQGESIVVALIEGLRLRGHRLARAWGILKSAPCDANNERMTVSGMEGRSPVSSRFSFILEFKRPSEYSKLLRVAYQITCQTFKSYYI
jgi:hypothetical protein